jgi:regulator of sigma E protease
MTISSLIIFLSILFALVVIHELGHFLFAKLFKVSVLEFAFGFPPRLLTKKIGETIYSFNLIPLGGYVKIFGENGLDDKEMASLTPEQKKGLFSLKGPVQKILILSGGVIFNIVGAIILFTVTFLMGSNVFLERDEVESINYQDRKLIVVEINEKSPLLGSGVTTGDRVVELVSEGEVLTGQSLNSFSASEFIQKHNNSIINIRYVDKTQQERSLEVVPKASIVPGKKVIGAKFADSAFKKLGFFDALSEGWKVTFFQLKLIFLGLGSLVYDLIYKDAKVEDNLSGPVGLALMTTKVSEKGIDQILIFAAMLSLSLAVFNILPIPALDGGRIVFVLFEVILGRKVKASTEQLFHGLGFMALLGLMLFVTYYDIVKALT